jgi:tetratricopeptide (TPR) repeat protein
MFTGKKLLQEKEYEKAKEQFVQASNVQQDSASLALLGTTYYKMGDLDKAERTIREAERIDKNSDYSLRILGYKSLILLKQNKPEGFNALRQYVDYLKLLGLPFEMYEIEMMIGKNTVDFAVLNSKIEEQTTWYEDEMERWSNGEPGYFSEKYGRRP